MAPVVVRGVLDEDDIAQVERLVARITRGGDGGSECDGCNVSERAAAAAAAGGDDGGSGGGGAGAGGSQPSSGGGGLGGAGGGGGEGVGEGVGTSRAKEVVHDEDEALAMELAAALLSEDDPAKMWSAMEDTYHALPTHRVVHLHAGDALANHAPRVRAKLLRAAFQADRDRGGGLSSTSEDEDEGDGGGGGGGGGWGLTSGRPVFIRSAEYHSYTQGGGVTDENHRDTGSVLTMSVLLEAPEAEDDGGGGELYTIEVEEGGGGGEGDRGGSGGSGGGDGNACSGGDSGGSGSGGGGGGGGGGVGASAVGKKAPKKIRASLKRGDAVVGRCKLNPFDPWLESAWFQAMSYDVKSRFQKFPFKCNLHRYAVVFPSEKRHGVTPVVGAGARRASVVLELWEHGVTKHNRQR
jgi:hypothetical protein